MKGIQYISDENNQRKAVIIDLKTLIQKPNQVEDALDALVAESRKEEPRLDWEKVKKVLRKEGKI